MILGIDLGTTRTLVSVADRGNFPSASFVRDDGDLVEHYPTVSAEVAGKLIHGLDAEAAERAGAPSLRSWKRLLPSVRKDETLVIGKVRVSPGDLVTSFLESLKRDLLERSNIAHLIAEPLETIVCVPANAHSTQRFVTLEGFRRAGFRVRAVVNEPSAAAIEFAFRHKNALNSRREHVVVYDLGGGTFDAALVHIADGRHDVERTAGINELGGDDFDAILCAMALEKAGRRFPEAAASRADLLRECRAAKESIHPNSRKVLVDLAGAFEDAPEEPVVIPLTDYYETVKPLVVRTLDAIAPLVDELRSEEESDIAGIYMVGGASGLPIVARTVRERFGRRVHRSPHPAAATAIGCAILGELLNQSDIPALSERFERHFGVFREADSGNRAVFDGIFEKGTPMPAAGGDPLVVTRTYRAAHNLGHYRFIESQHLDEHRNPSGDMTPHAEIVVPFFGGGEPAQASAPRNDIVRLPSEGPLIEERYEVDATGVIAVTISNLDGGARSRFIL